MVQVINQLAKEGKLHNLRGMSLKDRMCQISPIIDASREEAEKRTAALGHMVVLMKENEAMNEIILEIEADYRESKGDHYSKKQLNYDIIKNFMRKVTENPFLRYKHFPIGIKGICSIEQVRRAFADYQQIENAEVS